MDRKNPINARLCKGDHNQARCQWLLLVDACFLLHMTCIVRRRNTLQTLQIPSFVPVQRTAMCVCMLFGCPQADGGLKGSDTKNNSSKRSI